MHSATEELKPLASLSSDPEVKQARKWFYSTWLMDAKASPLVLGDGSGVQHTNLLYAIIFFIYKLKPLPYIKKMYTFIDTNKQK